MAGLAISIDEYWLPEKLPALKTRIAVHAIACLAWGCLGVHPDEDSDQEFFLSFSASFESA